MSDSPVSSYCRGNAHPRCVGDARDANGAVVMCSCPCHRQVTANNERRP